MAKLKIVIAGAPVLREVAQPVERIDKKLQRLLRDMAETMYAADGVGLAAPQVGVSKRVVVIDVGDGLYELINPEIVKREGKVLGSEPARGEDLQGAHALEGSKLGFGGGKISVQTGGGVMLAQHAFHRQQPRRLGIGRQLQLQGLLVGQSRRGGIGVVHQHLVAPLPQCCLRLRQIAFRQPIHR